MNERKIGGHESNLTPRVNRQREILLEKENILIEQHTESFPENKAILERILSTINFEELKNVFKEYLNKSGVPEENINVAALDEIVTRPLTAIASYSSLLNRITISTDDADFIKIKQVLQKKETIPKVMRMKLELALIHELCHAFSYQRLSSKDTNNSQSLLTTESGYITHTARIRQPMRPTKIGSRKEVSVSLKL